MALSTRRKSKMKPIEATGQDQFGYERTFVIRHDEACGVFGSIEAALGRIETFTH